MSILRDISRFLAGLCAIAAILTGSYMVWRVWGSGIDMAYTTHREEKAVGKTFREAAQPCRKVTLPGTVW